MADPNTKEREMASLYVFAQALNDQEINLPDAKEYGRVKVPAERLAMVMDKGLRSIWTESKIMDGSLKMEDIFSYQYQGQVLVDYLKQRGADHKKKLWKYGRFDGDQGVKSPLPLGTSILDQIWNLFTPEQKNLFSNKKSGQKDSWNPADVYLFDGDEAAVLAGLVDLQQKTALTENPKVFVSIVNDYLTKLFIENTLIGVSLKQATPPNIPKAKGINIVRDIDFEPPKYGQAKIIKGTNGYVHQYMLVEKKNGTLDFKGNSITFEVEVSMDGGEPLKYFWESKSPPESRPHVTEMKDMVSGGRNNTLKKANARGGSISKDLQFEPLIKEFTGKDWNNRVPTSTIKDQKEADRLAKYWSAYYLTLKASPLITLNDVEIKDSQGRTVFDNGTREGTIKYFRELFWIDKASQQAVKARYGMNKSSKWTRNFRGKLRGMIIMRAVVNANSAGRLGEFLTRAYYSAGKMKFRVDDLQGPFVKIQ